MSAFDLKVLASWLDERGLMEKPFSDMSAEEVNDLCEQVHNITDQESGYSPPYLKEDGELVIPATAPSKFKYWLPGGQPLRKTLADIGAPEEIIRRYDWKPEGGFKL